MYVPVVSNVNQSDIISYTVFHHETPFAGGDDDVRASRRDSRVLTAFTALTPLPNWRRKKQHIFDLKMKRKEEVYHSAVCNITPERGRLLFWLWICCLEFLNSLIKKYGLHAFEWRLFSCTVMITGGSRFTHPSNSSGTQATVHFIIHKAVMWKSLTSHNITW